LWWLKIGRESAGGGSMEMRVDGGQRGTPNAMKMFSNTPGQARFYRHVFEPWLYQMSLITAFTHDPLRNPTHMTVRQVLDLVMTGQVGLRQTERGIKKRNGALAGEVQWALEVYRHCSIEARTAGHLDTRNTHRRGSGDNILTSGTVSG